MSNAAISHESRSVSEIQQIPPGPALMQILLGGAVVPMIGAAVELGMIVSLGSGARTSARVAQVCGTPPETTHRLLRGLSVVGIVNEHIDGRFGLTALGECLLPDKPGSFDALALLNGSRWCGAAYLGLAEAVRTGKSAFAMLHGDGLYSWLAQHPAERELFGKAMSTFSGVEVSLILAAYDFSKASRIVDVGGGHGMLLSSILEVAPTATGALFDRPEVVADAQNAIKPEILERLTCEGGDFFERVPRHGDLYILKHILHNWDDEHAEAILRHVSKAMLPGGRVMVIEQAIASPGIPNPGKLMDMVMLALVEGGRERTLAEHASLMQRAGLQFEREITTPGAITLFVGVR